MPCKHEGGEDPCDRSPSGRCRVAVRLYAAQVKVSSKSKATKADSGEAGELLVASDLLSKGLIVTKPLNKNGSDDLHVKVSTGWISIQVKLATINSRTRVINGGSRSNPITSDVLALVYLPEKRIRWKSNNDRPVPKELL